MDASTSVEGFDLKQISVGEKTRLSDMSRGAGEKVIALYKRGRFVFDFAADVTLEEGDYLVVIAVTR
jgi:Trk K+ transport system NAD-binding subunit